MRYGGSSTRVSFKKHGGYVTPEQRAQLKIQREMASRTSTSIFDGRGNLDHATANRLSGGDVALGEYLDMSMIPFAPDPDGSDHAIHLSRLVSYIAKLPSGANGEADWGGIAGGPLSDHDIRVLSAVAMLYATGRPKPSDAYREMDAGPVLWEQISANVADNFFRLGGGAATYWSRPDVREEVCRLIVKHTDAREIAADKRLQVFEDARRYETVRYSPNFCKIVVARTYFIRVGRRAGTTFAAI